MGGAAELVKSVAMMSGDHVSAGKAGLANPSVDRYAAPGAPPLGLRPDLPSPGVGYRAFPARRGGGGGECGGGKHRYRRGGERNRHDLHEQNSVLVPAMPRGGGLLNRMHDTPVGAQ